MRDALLRNIARWTHDHYRLVLLLASLLTALSLWAAVKLEFTSQVADLLPPKSPVVQRYQRAMEAYGSMDFLIIALENKQGEDIDLYLDFADDFATSLLELPEVDTIEYRVDENIRRFYRETFAEYAFMFLSYEDLPKVLEKLTDNAIREQVARNRRDLNTAAGSALKPVIIKDPFNLRTVMAPYLQGAKGNMALSFRDGYYASADHTMLFLLVKPTATAQDTEFCKVLLSEVRRIEGEIRGDYPELTDLTIGYTGTYAIALDYVAAIGWDAVMTFIFAFVSVMLLFSFAFRQPGALIYVGIPLLMGVFWTLGFAYFSIGHLNVVTSTVGAILLGLGIDFGIHIFNQYAAERQAGADAEYAIEKAVMGSGKGLLSAALTTALAFYAMAPTGFRGLSEMGITTGTGILLCALAMLVVLPAMMTARAKLFKDDASHYSLQNFGLARLGVWLTQHSKAVLAVMTLITLVLCVFAVDVGFDDNFKNIRPKEGPALALQKRIIDTIGSPLIYNLVLVRGDTMEEAVALGGRMAERIEGLKNRGKVVSTNSLFTFLPSPKKQDENLAWLREVRANDPEFFSPSRIRTTFEIALEKEGFVSIEPFEEALSQIEKALTLDTPLTVETLESRGLDSVLRRFRSKYEDGSYETALYVYMDELMGKKEVVATLSDLDAVDNVNVVGMRMLGVELKRIVKRDFTRATIYALIVVFLVLFYHFRRLKHVLLVMTPLVVGVIWMLGIMRLLGIPFNLVNVTILPILIGIGIDDGIHMVHHFLTDGNRDVRHTLSLTGRAVVMTSLTTLAGFGSLIFSKYGGLHTVGQLALIGITTTLITAIIFLPPLIHVLHMDEKK